jgi:serine/threonine protein kinase
MNLKAILNQHYDISINSEIKVLAGNAYVFENNGRKLLWKRHNPLTIADVEQVDKIYRIAHREEFTPEMVPTVHGRFFCRSDNKIYSLQHYMDGKPVGVQDMTAVALRLFDLHQSLTLYDSEHFTSHFERIVPDIVTAARHYGYGNCCDTLNRALDAKHSSHRQVIHGDLHPKNLIKSRGNIFFLDFDSAHISSVEVDVAMAAFRLSGGDRMRMHLFVEAYNRKSPRRVELQPVIMILVYLIVQRILFILIEKERGIHHWLEDLENQRRYLEQAMLLLSQTG